MLTRGLAACRRSSMHAAHEGRGQGRPGSKAGRFGQPEWAALMPPQSQHGDIHRGSAMSVPRLMRGEGRQGSAIALEDIPKLYEALNQTQTQRDAEKEQNMESMKMAKEGRDAVKRAISVLKACRRVASEVRPSVGWCAAADSEGCREPQLGKCCVRMAHASAGWVGRRIGIRGPDHPLPLHLFRRPTTSARRTRRSCCRPRPSMTTPRAPASPAPTRASRPGRTASSSCSRPSRRTLRRPW